MNKKAVVVGHLDVTHKSIFFKSRFGTVEIRSLRSDLCVYGHFVAWDGESSHNTLPLLIEREFVDERIGELLTRANGEVLAADVSAVKVAVMGLVGAFMSPKARDKALGITRNAQEAPSGD